MMDKEYLNNPFAIIHGEPHKGRTEFISSEGPTEKQKELIDQADLYSRAHFRDGNLKSSKRHTRKNKKMARKRTR